MNVVFIFGALLAFFRTFTGVSTIQCKADDAEPWSYKGEKNGPREWGKTYPACYNKMQSPIDIKFAGVKTDPNLRPLRFKNYDESVSSAEVTNNGHTAMLTPDDGVVRTFLVNGEIYSLAQLHFHWGSNKDVGTEHLFNSKGYAMEAQFVHNNSRGEIAVVGVLYQAENFKNQEFVAIGEVLPKIRFKNETTRLRSPLNLSRLMPKLPLQFFRYNGSLTTPGCTEGVGWWVAQDVGSIGSNQLNILRRLFSVTKNEEEAGCNLQDNYRPVQPLNERIVTKSN